MSVSSDVEDSPVLGVAGVDFAATCLVRIDWLIIATVFSYSLDRLLSIQAAITLLGIVRFRADRSSVSRLIWLRYSSIELFIFERVVSNSSLHIRKSELNPFGSYRACSFCHNRQGSMMLRVCSRGPSAKASRM